MSTLNGVNYTQKWVTEEELSAIEELHAKNEGCLKCSGCTLIAEKNFSIIVNDDYMRIRFKKEIMKLQISYCPFCGKKL